MLEDVLVALIGAFVGAILAWLFDRRLMKKRLEQERRLIREEVRQESEQRLLDEVRLDAAKQLLQYLSRVLNREAPEALQNNVPELKSKWMHLNRHLYLLNAPDQERDAFDERMMMYLNSLAQLAKDPGNRPDVERLRARAKQEARDILQILGLATNW